jgi:beta-xylosidase
MNKMNFLNTIIIFLIITTFLSNAQEPGYAKNPVIWADVPDPSVIRVDSAYYMSSTTMHMNPGIPIMKSTDLVNWKIVNYAYDILSNNNAMNLNNGQEAYGRASWASSIRFHDSTYYVVTFSYTTNQTHIYHTNDIENGPWSAYTINTLFHDPSLLFDDGRVYLIYGINDIRIRELNPEVTNVQAGGINQVIIPNSKQIAGDGDFYVPAEGAHIHKINGKYYVFLITWPAGSMRTELVYRADSLTGPYEGKIALQDDGVAQGGIIQTIQGEWYGMLFRDYGSVGRIPYLVPVTWEDDWPVFGTNDQVPGQLAIPVTNDTIPGIVAADEFDWTSELPLVWQWNHNPDNDKWSVTDRPGYLRLTNGRVDTGFHDTRNTLTQRTFGPECSGWIAMDLSNMQDGDVAGFGALQWDYGYVAVKMTGTSKAIVMVNGNSGQANEIENIPVTQDTVYLGIAFDFNNRRDRAYFYYSLDGISYNAIGNWLQMNYSLEHFMEYRFALFNYATISPGGYVDFDYFRINNSLNVPTVLENKRSDIPLEFHMEQNFPNPFNPKTRISFDIPVFTNISINVYDITGRHVQTLIDEEKTPGRYTILFDGSYLSSGMYLYQLRASNFEQMNKMLLLK